MGNEQAAEQDTNQGDSVPAMGKNPDPILNISYDDESVEAQQDEWSRTSAEW